MTVRGEGAGRKPTKVALQHLLPRMPKGEVLAFDGVAWKTPAMLDEVAAGRIQSQRHDFDPYVGFAVPG